MLRETTVIVDLLHKEVRHVKVTEVVGHAEGVEFGPLMLPSRNNFAVPNLEQSDP